MVQAIAVQTLRHATDLQEASESLLQRYKTLGKAHDILFDGAVQAAGVLAIIRDAIALHEDGSRGRFHVSGPDLEVGPQAVLMLALMLHELSTNATKYGSLSTDTGSVSVTWSLSADEAQPVFVLFWRESGGPPVLSPTRQGFGSRLIRGALAGAVGGKTTLEFPPEDAVCRFEAPWSGLTRDKPGQSS